MKAGLRKERGCSFVLYRRSLGMEEKLSKNVVSLVQDVVEER